MQYWLMKSEPDVYPWSKLVADKKGEWDGVRNYQAANNMKAMAKGDLAFFYHSNEGREIVGVMEISKTCHPDPTDASGRFVMVGVKPVKPLKTPVTLAAIKAHDVLKGMALVRQSRLSVSPVTAKEWKILCRMGGV